MRNYFHKEIILKVFSISPCVNKAEAQSISFVCDKGIGKEH